MLCQVDKVDLAAYVNGSTLGHKVRLEAAELQRCFRARQRASGSGNFQQVCHMYMCDRACVWHCNLGREHVRQGRLSRAGVHLLRTTVYTLHECDMRAHVQGCALLCSLYTYVRSLVKDSAED